MAKTQKLVVVDYRALVKNISFSLLSGSMAIQFPTEPAEIAYRLAKRFYCIRLEHPWHQIIIANDVKPYWRTFFLEEWYSARGQEPVVYKGNRGGREWPFQTPPETMEAVYQQLKVDLAKAVGGTVIESEGLEADDIWGLLAYQPASNRELVAYTTDSDWAQLITPDGRVKIYDFSRDEWRTEPADIRIKWIAGDAGDGIKGCTKLKKDGTPAKTGWGPAGAKKLLEENPEGWEKVLDPEELEKNKKVVTLPPPHWDIKQARHQLKEDIVSYKKEEGIFERYGVTKKIQDYLETEQGRKEFLNKLRMYLNPENPSV